MNKLGKWLVKSNICRCLHNVYLAKRLFFFLGLVAAKFEVARCSPAEKGCSPPPGQRRSQTAALLHDPASDKLKKMNGCKNVTLTSVWFSQLMKKTRVSRISALLPQLSIISGLTRVINTVSVSVLRLYSAELLFILPVTFHHPATSLQMFVPILLEFNLGNSNWIQVSRDSSVPHIRYLFCYNVISLL